MRYRSWCGALAAIALVLLASPALAGRNQERITKYTVKAQQLEAKDSKKSFTQELGLLRAWLQEAQSFLSQDEGDLVKKALARVKVQSRLVEALLAKQGAEETAAAAHEAAEAKEKEAREMQRAAAALEKEQTDLEKRGL